MKQSATVISTSGNIAVVTAERASMCDGCHKKGCSDGCSMYSIFGGDKNFSAEADNSFGADEGSRVIVEATDKSIFFSAFIVFLLPLIVSFAAYFIFRNWLSEEYSIIIALSVFVVYFAVLGIYERTAKAKKPKLKIIGYAEENN